MNPLLRKWKAAALRLAKQWKAGLKRLIARPRSLERLLLFTIAGIVLFAIVAIALASLGLLRDQAQEQALSRVRAAAHQVRYEIRRVGEDTVTAARLLASRPTLARSRRPMNSTGAPLRSARAARSAAAGPSPATRRGMPVDAEASMAASMPFSGESREATSA